MLPYGMIASGTFTVTEGSPTTVSCQSQNPPDFVIAYNLGSSASTGWGELSDAQEIQWFWQRSMAQGTAKGIRQSSDASNPAMIATFVSTQGISCYDTVNPPSFPTLACSAVTRGSAGGVTVVTMANTGDIGVGDRVTICNVAGMQQISQMEFQVVAVTVNTSITISLDSSDFAADGTTGLVQKYIPYGFYPRYNWITGISKATQCVVDTTIDSDFTIGEIVRFTIPNGITTMSELQYVDGKVLAITNATPTTCAKITLDVDTTGFTTFALPTSAQMLSGVSSIPPKLNPSASGVVPNQQPPGTNLLDAYDNRSTRIIVFGANLFQNGTTGDVWTWMAFKSDQYNGN